MRVDTIRDHLKSKKLRKKYNSKEASSFSVTGSAPQLNMKTMVVVTVDYLFYSFNVNVIHKCGFMMN